MEAESTASEEQTRKYTSRFPSAFASSLPWVLFTPLVISPFVWIAIPLFQAPYTQTTDAILRVCMLALGSLWFVLPIARYGRLGLIQPIFLLVGLGPAFGYGSFFRKDKKPRAGSDLDLGVLASRFVKHYWAKRDPRIWLAAWILKRLIGNETIDISYNAPHNLEEHVAVCLLNPCWERRNGYRPRNTNGKPLESG